MRYRNTALIFYFDLDGVLADFDVHLSAIWPTRPSFDTNRRGSLLNEEELTAKHRAYDRLAACEDFYDKLPWCPGARQMWAAAVSSGHRVGVLSAVPSFHHLSDATERERLILRSIAEKEQWIRRELSLPLPHPDVRIVRRSEDKALYVPSAPVIGVLIDDRPENITQWRDSGGVGIAHRTVEETLAAIHQLSQSNPLADHGSEKTAPRTVR